MSRVARLALVVSLLAALSAHLQSQTTYIPYARARPVFDALGEPMPSEREWSQWIAGADAVTRARVAAGDEMSIVNLLLFGTSFTSQPRITSGQLTADGIRAAVATRLDDFERALARPGADERLQFARRLLEGSTSPRARMLFLLDRAIKEGEVQARLSTEARALGDASLEFAERSRIYRDRGLASDTSVRVNFAIEEALRGLIPVLSRAVPPGTTPVTRVAVIGPGLDVIDKQDGYDFYPPQTIQPFAIIDSLIRLGLADAASIAVATFDVSARVNSHIANASRQSRPRTSYILHIALDGRVMWAPDMNAYVERFGTTIGQRVPVTVPPGIGPVMLRALAVRPSIVDRIAAHDLNVTAQRLTLRENERFDLMIGTNIFVYYDRLQQGLAMANVADMLRPGGLLLSNNALVEVPATGMRSIGYSKVLYSNREEDGDLIIWYQRLAGSR